MSLKYYRQNHYVMFIILALKNPKGRALCRPNWFGSLHTWPELETDSMFWFPVASVAPWVRNSPMLTILCFFIAHQNVAEQAQSRQDSTNLPVQPSAAGLQPFHTVVEISWVDTGGWGVKIQTVSVLNLWCHNHFTTSSALVSPIGRR